MSDKKLLLILVDPHAVNIRDLIGVKHPETKGIRIVRYRHNEWGKHPPLQLFFINSEDTKTFMSLAEFKKHYDIEEKGG